MGSGMEGFWRSKCYNLTLSDRCGKCEDVSFYLFEVTLVGFGSFEARERKARQGRNPKTGEKMEIPATTVPAFSAGKGFKELVAKH